MFDRLQVRSFKSLRHVDLRLPNLAVFVGENGAGKSNLLDAVRFVADALDVGLDHAVRTRGGVDAVRRKTSGDPTHFEIGLDVRTRAVQGRFQFKVGARPRVSSALATAATDPLHTRRGTRHASRLRTPALPMPSGHHRCAGFMTRFVR